MDVIKSVNVDLLLSTSCKVYQGCFARAVASAVRDVDCASSTGNVKNTTAALASEDRQEKAHENIRSMEIDLELLDKLLWILQMHLLATSDVS